MVLIPHRLALLPAQPVTNKLVWDAQEPRGGGDVASRLFQCQVHEAIDSVLELEALRREPERRVQPVAFVAVTAPPEVSYDKCAKLRSTPGSNTMARSNSWASSRTFPGQE